jgi:hypothetical protein
MRTTLVLFSALASSGACESKGVRSDIQEASDAADTSGDIWRNHVLCPSNHPALLPLGAPQGCSPGLECHWPAAGCAEGRKPDNVCICGPNGWECEAHVRNCLPIQEGLLWMVPDARPAPPHRPEAESCSDPSAEPREATCTALNSQGAGTCDNNADCAADAVCLDTHVFGGISACSCQTVECRSDDDCPASSLCHCGTTRAGTRCNGLAQDTCGHRCDPADCRVDADCGAGKFCSPSFDDCDWDIEQWACHDPERDECLTNAECAWSKEGPLCQFRDAQGWKCVSMPICE